jgi:hypothetical protein
MIKDTSGITEFTSATAFICVLGNVAGARGLPIIRNHFLRKKSETQNKSNYLHPGNIQV